MGCHTWFFRKISEKEIEEKKPEAIRQVEYWWGQRLRRA